MRRLRSAGLFTSKNKKTKKDGQESDEPTGYAKFFASEKFVSLNRK